MKIASKIALGYGILITLILAVLTYQVFLMNRMEAINRDLTKVNFRAATVSLELLRDLDQVEEFTRKYFATGGDPGYGERIEEMREAFEQILRELQSLQLSAGEKGAIAQLDGLWGQFAAASARARQAVERGNARQIESSLADQVELLGALRVRVQGVIRTTRLAIEAHAEESARAGQNAQRISWMAALAALFASLLVSVWIVRSISSALKQLTEGTQAVARGKFFYQLDTSGSDELAQLALDFNTMTRRLGELDQMKKDFVSHVSHELKSPLASIEETIRLLLEKIPGPLTDQQKRLLEVNLQSSHRLSFMIGNLLDLSRMEAGVMEYQFEQHDLGASVRTALAELEVQAREKFLRIEGQLPKQPVLVECDEGRIIQVIANVLGNAVKFSSPDGAIQVSLNRLARIPGTLPEPWRGKISATDGRGYALISVADSGPGIPDSEKEKVFEKFHQVRPAAGKGRGGEREGADPPHRLIGGQGVGLGLAIGRTIVEAHGGAVWIEDNPGGGSVFHILLAAGTVSEPAVAHASRPI